MALSGTIYGSTLAKGYRMEIEWSATQSISNNSSTITARIYWHSLGSGWDLYSNATKTVTATIDGTSNNKSASGLATLNGNQRKLIHTYSRTVSHASDGTKTLTISGRFPVNITLYSGAVVGTATASKSVTLDTIPRKSTMTTSRNFTAGSNRTVTISRASSSFRHEVEIDIQRRDGVWDWIKRLDFSTSQTSLSTSFSTSNNEEIFRHLDGRSSAPVRMRLQTFSGSTYIGQNSYTGTVTAPTASTVTITNPTNVSVSSGQGHNTVYIDQSIGISVSRKNSGFTHTLVFKDGNSGATIHRKTGVTTSYTWNPTPEERTHMYNKTPNGIEFDGQIDVYTYYGSEQVRSVVAKDINFRVRNSNPTFGAGFTYRDSNTSVTSVTGNNQYIVQNKSNLIVEIPSTVRATAINGATMKEYIVTVNGVTKTIAYSTSTVSANFGAINTNSDTTISIRAVDSRGNSTTSSKTISVVPYSEPVLNIQLSRANNFEESTTLSVSGSISPLSINGTPKNSIQLLEYRYRQTNGTWVIGWTGLSYTMNGFNFTVPNVVNQLDNLLAFTFEIQCSDTLSSRVVSRPVGVGRPIFFIDTELLSVGVGKFPEYTDSLEIEGVAYASDFQNNSSEKIKQDIEVADIDALLAIYETSLFKYRLKTDVKKGVLDDWKYGMVIERGIPQEVVNSDGNSISNYSMNTLSWIAIKQLKDENDELRREIAEIKSMLGNSS